MTKASAGTLGRVYSNRQQVIVEVDDALLEIVGRERRELIGQSSLFCTYDSDLVVNRPLLDGLSQDGAAFAITKRYVRGDGSIVWVQNHVLDVRATGTPLLCATSRLRERPFESADLTRNYRRARQICAALVSARAGPTAGIASAPAIEALLWLYRAEIEGRVVLVEELAADLALSTTAMRRWVTLLRDRGLIEAEKPTVGPATIVRIARACERKLDGMLAQLAG